MDRACILTHQLAQMSRFDRDRGTDQLNTGSPVCTQGRKLREFPNIGRQRKCRTRLHQSQRKSRASIPVCCCHRGNHNLLGTTGSWTVWLSSTFRRHKHRTQSWGQKRSCRPSKTCPVDTMCMKPDFGTAPVFRPGIVAGPSRLGSSGLRRRQSIRSRLLRYCTCQLGSSHSAEPNRCCSARASTARRPTPHSLTTSRRCTAGGDSRPGKNE